MKYFNQFVQELRIKKGMSLREFCREACLDPSNWSKVERGIADQPKSKVLLNRIAQTLKLDQEETNELMDLAMIDSIPIDLRPSEDVLQKLPIFLKTIRDVILNDSELIIILDKLTNE